MAEVLVRTSDGWRDLTGARGPTGPPGPAPPGGGLHDALAKASNADRDLDWLEFPPPLAWVRLVNVTPPLPAHTVISEAPTTPSRPTIRRPDVYRANANGALTVEGVTPLRDDHLLIASETHRAGIYNGVFNVDAPGSATTPWQLSRASVPGFRPGSLAYVREGRYAGRILMLGHGGISISAWGPAPLLQPTLVPPDAWTPVFPYAGFGTLAWPAGRLRLTRLDLPQQIKAVQIDVTGAQAEARLRVGVWEDVSLSDNVRDRGPGGLLYQTADLSGAAVAAPTAAIGPFGTGTYWVGVQNVGTGQATLRTGTGSNPSLPGSSVPGADNLVNAWGATGQASGAAGTAIGSPFPIGAAQRNAIAPAVYLQAS